MNGFGQNSSFAQSRLVEILLTRIVVRCKYTLSTVKTRLICSLLALGIVWALSGILFTFANGVGFLRAWLIGGTAMFLLGWIIVGFPIVALGDRISSIRYFFVVALISGLGGASILFLPDLLTRITDRKHQYPWSLVDLGWPAIGFSIGAATALMYCIFLRNSIAGGSRSEHEVLS